MRALEIITGHVINNPAYTYKFQLKTINESETVVGEIINDLENLVTPIDANETRAAGPAKPEIQQQHFPQESLAELEAKIVDDETTKLLNIQN